MMKRKKGNTRSASVMPFHLACFSMGKMSSPAPLFTKIISITVSPLSTSRLISRWLLPVAVGGVAWVGCVWGVALGSFMGFIG